MVKKIVLIALSFLMAIGAVIVSAANAGPSVGTLAGSSGTGKEIELINDLGSVAANVPYSTSYTNGTAAEITPVTVTLDGDSSDVTARYTADAAYYFSSVSTGSSPYGSFEGEAYVSQNGSYIRIIKFTPSIVSADGTSVDGIPLNLAAPVLSGIKNNCGKWIAIENITVGNYANDELNEENIRTACAHIAYSMFSLIVSDGDACAKACNAIGNLLLNPYTAEGEISFNRLDDVAIVSSDMTVSALNALGYGTNSSLSSAFIIDFMNANEPCVNLVAGSVNDTFTFSGIQSTTIATLSTNTTFFDLFGKNITTGA